MGPRSALAQHPVPTPFGRATNRHAPDTAEAATVTAGVIDEWKDRMKIQVINLPWCFLPDHEAHVAGDAGKLARIWCS